MRSSIQKVVVASKQPDHITYDPNLVQQLLQLQVHMYLVNSGHV